MLKERRKRTPEAQLVVDTPQSRHISPSQPISGLPRTLLLCSCLLQEKCKCFAPLPSPAVSSVPHAIRAAVGEVLLLLTQSIHDLLEPVASRNILHIRSHRLRRVFQRARTIAVPTRAVSHSTVIAYHEKQSTATFFIGSMSAPRRETRGGEEETSGR